LPAAQRIRWVRQYFAISKVLMKKIAIAIFVSAAAFGGSAQATAPATFELKGYALGADLANCPAGFTTDRDGAITQCRSLRETLGGKPVKYFVIYTYKAKIVGVAARGMDKPMDVANALIMKFGQPLESKKRLQEYTWNKGDAIMRVDAFNSTGGTVMLKDFAGYGAGKAENARAAQSDL